MNRRHLRGAADRRRRRWLVACAGLAPLLAACSGAAAQVQLPARPGDTAPLAAGSPSASTPRQQVAAGLVGYTAALGRAEASRNAAQARSLLRPYLAASRIGGLVSAVSLIWAKGESFYGQDALHILTIRIVGRRAYVHDCDDTSAMRLEYVSTGQTVSGSAGVPRANLVTRLDLVRGRWLVQTQLPEDLPCVP